MPPGLVHYGMSSELPPKPRAGKYCPRCHAMTLREQAVCGQCGHHFRTGTENPVPESETNGPDPLHRTMQFTLPPLAPRTASPAEPVSAPNAIVTSRRTVFAALAVLMLCLAAALLWSALHGVAKAETPVGVWETTLHSKTSADAHLEFVFNPGGTGRFSWRESGPAALSGQTPLQWRRAGEMLTLRLDKPAGDDLVPQTLVGIFSSHPWPFRVDRAHGQLVLGTLVFTEKP